jgi:hypothetical protein
MFSNNLHNDRRISRRQLIVGVGAAASVPALGACVAPPVRQTGPGLGSLPAGPRQPGKTAYGSPPYVDARDFGCALDGRRDDTVAMQRAINAVAAVGGSLFVSGPCAISSTLTIGGRGNPVAGFTMTGPMRATNKHAGFVWIGEPGRGLAMLYIRNAYGGSLENLAFDGDNKADYGLQLQHVLGDANVVEHWMIVRCFFSDARIYNTLIGDIDARVDTSNGDVSAIEFHNCIWQRSFVGTRTKAHLAHQSANSFANTFHSCQFDQGTGTCRYNAIVTCGRCALYGCVDSGSCNVPAGAVIWTAERMLPVGTYIVATRANAQDLYFQATAVNGPTGVAEPAWPKSRGGAVRDGGVTWTAIDGITASFLLATTSSQIPGSIDFYNHESQSANWLDVDPAIGASGQFPVTVSGLHHADIYGVGSYSIRWAANYYSSLNVLSGFLGRGIVHNGPARNVNLIGAQFASANGGLRGPGAGLVAGWWTLDGRLIWQIPSAGDRGTPPNESLGSAAAQIQSSSSVTQGAVTSICDDREDGFLFVTDHTTNLSALYVLTGSSHSSVKMLDSGGGYGTRKDTGGTVNIYWESSSARYVLQNNSGTPGIHTFSIGFTGHGGH